MVSSVWQMFASSFTLCPGESEAEETGCPYLGLCSGTTWHPKAERIGSGCTTWAAWRRRALVVCEQVGAVEARVRFAHKRWQQMGREASGRVCFLMLHANSGSRVPRQILILQVLAAFSRSRKCVPNLNGHHSLSLVRHWLLSPVKLCKCCRECQVCAV